MYCSSSVSNRCVFGVEPADSALVIHGNVMAQMTVVTERMKKDVPTVSQKDNFN